MDQGWVAATIAGIWAAAGGADPRSGQGEPATEASVAVARFGPAAAKGIRLALVPVGANDVSLAPPEDDRGRDDQTEEVATHPTDEGR